MAAVQAEEKELSLWQIIEPVKREVYIGMVMSAVSGLTWMGALLLIRPIAGELLADVPNTTVLWQSLGAAIG